MESSGSISSAALRLAFALALVLALPWARADAPADLEQQVRALAIAGAQPNARAGVTRVEVQVGQLDPRLRLAPCQRIEPYLPAGTRLWGRTRIGLRCTEGASRWNVFLPVAVKLFGPALVVTAPLPAGHVLAEADLASAELDLAEEASPALIRSELAVGRSLARALDAGQGLRQAHLKPRQWFAAGEPVKVVALGAGFSVAGEGLAMTPGVEGQPARVRTESGRVLVGMPVGERRMELSL
jgi:flagella basal body P-ring formation protein FlgA